MYIANNSLLIEIYLLHQHICVIIDNPIVTNGELRAEPAIRKRSSRRVLLDPCLEERIRSSAEVDDTAGLISLLRKVLVFEPPRRPDVSDILDHPWFGESSSPSAHLVPHRTEVSLLLFVLIHLRGLPTSLRKAFLQ